MKRLTTRILVFSLALSAVVCLAEDRHTKDSLDMVKKGLAEEKAVLVDVREKKEWDAGHLEQAKLVPLSKLRKETDLEKLAKSLANDLPKDKIIYTHCRSGVRCVAAADVLKKLEEYRLWGVPHIWIVDPWRRTLSVYDKEGLITVSSFVINEMGIEIPHAEILA